MNAFKIIAAIVVSGLALLFAIDFRFFFFLLVIIFLFFIPFSILNRKLFFIVILAPFFLLPQLDRYHILPILTWQITIPMIVVIMLFIFSRLRINNSYNILMILFFGYILFETFRGWSLGYKNYYVVEETLKYLLYPIGYFFTYSIFDDTEDDFQYLKNILIALIIFGIFISLQILFYYFTITLGNRVITRQANLLLISFISASAYMLYYSRRMYCKIFLIASMLLYIIATIIMMQRSLWIGFIISILLFFILYMIKFKKKKKNLVIVFILIAVLVGSFVIFQSFSLNKEVLEERTEVIQQKEKTFSVGVRILSYYQALRLFTQSPIIGKGMGDAIITPYLNQREIGAVDNSYLVILWKFGILGFGIFVIIYFKFISQLVKIIKYSKEKVNVLYGITILAIIVGQIINGLACVVLTLYYYNLIWGALIAITDYLYRKEFIFNE